MDPITRWGVSLFDRAKNAGGGKIGSGASLFGLGITLSKNIPTWPEEFQSALWWAATLSVVWALITLAVQAMFGVKPKPSAAPRAPRGSAVPQVKSDVPKG